MLEAFSMIVTVRNDCFCKQH